VLVGVPLAAIVGNDPLGQSFGTHPSVARRHERVLRFGTLPQSPRRSPFAAPAGLSSWRAWAGASLVLTLCALMIVLVPLMLYLLVAVTLLALMVGMMWVMVLLLPLRWLLG